MGVLTTTGAQFALARYNSDGSLDTTFGNSGSTITQIQQSAAGTCLTIQQDNDIVLAGGASPGGDDIKLAVARYQAGPLAGEFSLSANQLSQTVDAGSSADFTIDVQPVTGSSPPTSQVALSASISPAATGSAASFANTPVAIGGSGQLEVSTTMSTRPGPYTVTITGMAGSIKETTTVTVTVTTGPDFALGFNSPSVTASPGTKAAITVLVNRTDGFTGKVRVTAPSSLPAGVTIKGDQGVSTKGMSVTFKLKIGDDRGRRIQRTYIYGDR